MTGRDRPRIAAPNSSYSDSRTPFEALGRIVTDRVKIVVFGDADQTLRVDRADDDVAVVIVVDDDVARSNVPSSRSSSSP